jgi:hypothetical protein
MLFNRAWDVKERVSGAGSVGQQLEDEGLIRFEFRCSNCDPQISSFEFRLPAAQAWKLESAAASSGRKSRTVSRRTNFKTLSTCADGA